MRERCCTVQRQVVRDAQTVGEVVADQLVATIGAGRDAGRSTVIGWPVGRTPVPVVDALRRLAALGRLRLDDVHVLLMDDYVQPAGDDRLRRVPLSSPYSCRGTAMRQLVTPLSVHARFSSRRMHSPDPDDPAAYESLIERLGGIDAFVVALGSGDGHVALNPPGSARGSRTRVVTVADSTRQDNVATFGLSRLSDVPARGVTVGLATIMAARRVIVVAHGREKRTAVRRLVDGSGFDSRWPMTVLRDHPNAVLICDEASLGRTA